MKIYPFDSLDAIVHDVMEHDQQLILLAGASASGKSFVAEQMASSLRDHDTSVLIISSDDYYSDQTNLQYVLYGTFDHPHLIHYDALGDDIESLLTTGHFDKPQYSFVEKRSTHTIPVDGSYDYIIVEGLYTIDQLQRRFPQAINLFVESSYEEIIFRRIVRDQERVRESNHMMINNIGKAFPMWNIFGEHQKHDADIVITNDYEILDHKGTTSAYEVMQGEVAHLGVLDLTEHCQHFVYSNTDNNESDIVITEVYYDDDPLLKYIMISAVKYKSDTSDEHIDVTLYDPGALTDMHILLQTAGLDLIDRFETTKSHFLHEDNTTTTLLTKDDVVYKQTT